MQNHGWFSHDAAHFVNILQSPLRTLRPCVRHEVDIEPFACVDDYKKNSKTFSNNNSHFYVHSKPINSYQVRTIVYQIILDTCSEIEAMIIFHKRHFKS